MIERSRLSSALQNHPFQDWMAETRLMRRMNPIPENDSILVNKPTPPDTITSSVLETLLHNRGYIVSNDHLQERIAQNDNPSIGTAVHNLRARYLDNPDCIQGFQNIGYSIGVTDLETSPNQLLLLNQLWENAGYPTTQTELAEFLWNIVDDYSLESVRKTISQLRNQILPRAGLTIDINPNTREYRLRQSDSLYVMPEEIDDYLPTYLATGYQDWLASKGVEIIKRHDPKNLHKPLGMFFKYNLTHYQAVITSIFDMYPGYFIPKSFFVDALYGPNSGQGKNVADMLSYINREAVTKPGVITYKDKLGYAKGVKEVNARAAGLVVLHALWSRPNEAFTYEDIRAIAYHNGALVQKDTIEQEIRRLKQHFNNHQGVQILTERHKNGLSRYCLPLNGTQFDRSAL